MTAAALAVEVDTISLVAIVLGPVAVGAILALIGWRLGKRD